MDLMDCVSRRIIRIENRRVRDIDTHVYGESHATPHHHLASREVLPGSQYHCASRARLVGQASRRTALCHLLADLPFLEYRLTMYYVC